MVVQERSPAQSSGKIFWSKDEYIALARELHRASPSSNYHRSETLAGLSVAELREAERNVLPADRRLETISTVRPRLVEAFKTIQDELVQDEMRAQEEVRERAHNFLEAIYSQAEPKPEPKPEPEPVAVPVAQPAPVAEAYNPHEIALKLLVEMLVSSLAARIAPELTKLLPAMAALVAPLAPVAATQPFVARQAPAPEAAPMEDPLEHQPPSDWKPPEFTLPSTLKAPRLPMIGILGLKPVQVQELRDAFPVLEFVSQEGTHSNKTLASLQSAVRVISVNTSSNSMNQLTDKMLAQHFKDRYVRAQGGMSSVKRQIQIWIQAGALQ